MIELFQRLAGGSLAELGEHVLIGVGEEPARSTAWIIDSLADLRLHDIGFF